MGRACSGLSAFCSAITPVVTRKAVRTPGSAGFAGAFRPPPMDAVAIFAGGAGASMLAP